MTKLLIVILIAAGALSASTITESFTSSTEEACLGACSTITLDIPQLAQVNGEVEWSLTDEESYLFVYDNEGGAVGEYPGEPYSTVEGVASSALGMILSSSQSSEVGVPVWWLDNEFSASGTLDGSVLQGDGTFQVDLRPFQSSTLDEMNYLTEDQVTLTLTIDPPGTSEVPEPSMGVVVLGGLLLGGVIRLRRARG